MSAIPAPGRMTRSTTWRTALLGAALTALLALSACGGGDDEVTLRVAMGSPGEAQIAVWEAAGEAFEAEHDDVTVEFNFQDDDLYQTIGLPNLLSGDDAPDIYFEWAGARLTQRYEEGYAADLDDALTGELGEYFDDGAFNGMHVDGKTVMVPGNADVTTVVWYNTDVFDELGLTAPTSWEDFLEVSATIREAGITPVALGNKDLWPGGNWASHIFERVAGPDVYDQVLSGEVALDAPEVVESLTYLQELADAAVVNESANAIDDNEGAQLFFRESAAMHPIGSWLVSWAIEEAPDLKFDFFNLPAMPGDGAQDSVIAVSTGYVVNAESDHQEEAIEFLSLFSSPEFTSQMVDAGGTPLATGALDRDDIDPRSQALMELMQSASAVVSPPDVGYDLERADALYAAQAEVLGGVSSPQEAAEAAAGKLGG